MHYNTYHVFYFCTFLSKMFRPLLLPSSGWWCDYKNTKVFLYPCNNHITLKMAVIAAERVCWESMNKIHHNFLKFILIHDRSSFVILYYDQQIQNYFTNYYTPTCFDTRQLVISTLPSYTSISNAAVGNTVYS